MITITEYNFLEELERENIKFESINELLVNKLIERKLKIASAESCTGGLISEKITEISGASNVFDCGICSYSNDIKHKLLKVEENTLRTLGAVSAETAIQMASGVMNVANSNIGISTTGIAGPTGGTAEKPVGLVYIGCATNNSSIAVKALFNADKNNTRERIRELAATYAMYLAYKNITNLV